MTMDIEEDLDCMVRFRFILQPPGGKCHPLLGADRNGDSCTVMIQPVMQKIPMGINAFILQ